MVFFIQGYSGWLYVQKVFDLIVEVVGEGVDDRHDQEAHSAVLISISLIRAPWIEAPVSVGRRPIPRKTLHYWRAWLVAGK